MNETVRVLVVGGAGYIGSHMVHVLRDAGYAVAVLDNLSRGHRDAVGDSKLFEVDLCDQAAVLRCLNAYQPRVVMHFAALAYVGESVKDPAVYYRNNVAGSLALLDAMVAAKIEHLVFSSTCATYGVPDADYIDEKQPQVPINPYGWTKFMIERAIADYSSAYGISAVALRYFNAAGADEQLRAGERHDPETHLIPLVLSEALRVRNGGDPSATPLQVFGEDFPTPDGSCVRDYIHVSDLCRAHLEALRRLVSRGIRGTEAFNLANGQGFSVFEVIRACERVTGQAIKFTVGPRRLGDPPRLVGSAQKAIAGLNWQPQVTNLDSIVASAWRYMLANQPRL